MSSDLTCGRCGKTEARVMVNGTLTDPLGWAHMTMSGLPVQNWLLCGWCANYVRDAIAAGVGS